jgi:hypothetical protein
MGQAIDGVGVRGGQRRFQMFAFAREVIEEGGRDDFDDVRIHGIDGGCIVEIGERRDVNIGMAGERRRILLVAGRRR